MLEASVANMNPFGRIAVCGIISEYTGIGERAAPDMIDIVYKRLKIQGFLVIDYLKGMDDFISTTSNHLSTGKIHVLEDISQGVESISSAFVGLFQGDNVGKKVVKVADEWMPTEDYWILLKKGKKVKTRYIPTLIFFSQLFHR